MQIPMTVTLTSQEDPVDVVAGPAEQIALEREYKIDANALRDTPHVEHLAYLAYVAHKRLARIAHRDGTDGSDVWTTPADKFTFPKFDEWLDDLEDLDVGSKDDDGGVSEGN